MKPQLIDYQLSPDVRAFSTTRLGGVGEGNYSEFNITHYCGDSIENVIENRKLLCEELGINDHQLFLPRQVHGTKLLRIDDSFLKLNDRERTAAMEGIDAVVTSIPGLCIGVSTADCVPVLLYDVEQKVIAAVHAGWRGTLEKIVISTIDFMQNNLGCSPKSIKAVIGPSISMEAFEVGKEVYMAFSNAGFPMNSMSRFYPNNNGDTILNNQLGKWHLDLWAANCLQLEECGVELENIQVANICTAASSDTFFSARILGLNSGRIFNGIMLK